MADGRQAVVLLWKWLLSGQLAKKKRTQKDNEEIKTEVKLALLLYLKKKQKTTQLFRKVNLTFDQVLAQLY